MKGSAPDLPWVAAAQGVRVRINPAALAGCGCFGALWTLLFRLEVFFQREGTENKTVQKFENWAVESCPLGSVLSQAPFWASLYLVSPNLFSVPGQGLQCPFLSTGNAQPSPRRSPQRSPLSSLSLSVPPSSPGLMHHVFLRKGAVTFALPPP